MMNGSIFCHVSISDIDYMPPAFYSYSSNGTGLPFGNVIVVIFEQF